MKLHGTSTSPYVRKVRALIIEKQLDVRFVAAANSADPASPAKRLNPLGKVPVLELDDGQVLFDSPVIAEYLDALAAPRLIPQEEAWPRWHVLRLCALADGLADAVVARLIECRRPEAQRSAQVVQREEQRVAQVIGALEEEVWRAGATPGLRPRALVGEALTLADLAVGVAVGYVDFRYPHDWRPAAPHLASWVESLCERPALRDTVPAV